MAARKHREIHDVEQTDKMHLFITSEIAFRWNVSELAFGIDILDLDYGIQVDSVKKPV